MNLSNRRARKLGYWIAGVPVAVVMGLFVWAVVDMAMDLPRDQFWLMVFVTWFTISVFVGINLAEAHPAWRDND